jgi:predicted 3-demethylubiquinone-9 3-methyltransferase (glyoxalase superfamily)
MLSVKEKMIKENVFRLLGDRLESELIFKQKTGKITQEEIDHFWDKLGTGGKYNQCGWLDDKFGVSWQIVPSILGQLMSDPEKSPRVVQAFMQMTKFDIQQLLDA